ncbi:hypothetical protein COLO4_24027 [Corchorus olitorius]|uniref:Uncharacterized protein n=1 Tax=Corchorus olitorius TaxID=93759 RepID=A0A1R3IDA3_9ROSI|nr:hypothetical protein COLO4_24027 [Corchorus olitorius]
MAISTRCFLNFPPPTRSLDVSPSNNKATQFAWPRDDKWRKQCLLGVACMVIGLQTCNMTNNDAIAEEALIVIESNSRTARWSDKRTCPPWTANSLETIVPENLPRPSAKRRWESTGLSKAAPAAKETTIRKIRTGCFSM